MTRTFNSGSYSNLLVRYQPKPILTEAENDAAIALAQELEHRPELTPEEDLFLELLITLIEKFENEHYPIPEVSPDQILRYILEVSNTHEVDLIGILGSTSDSVSDIVQGRIPIDDTQAKILAERFKLSSSLFQENRLDDED